MTRTELTARFGRHWMISSGVGADWYAVRRTPLSARGLEHGLCDVRCGADLSELGRRLDAELRLEGQMWGHAPSQRAS
ncbi:hypothetical protein FHS43_002761 [Streptosporangium becharense]|uniref:Uncharacterized protein n=1 Tax=Streptosporangium becharense TaxID=1816182 RepID=A0A7W9IL06_9ACTN|nr:hypothetical protein [Streptosporangium becharense]MBB2911488.1 hypothetical protein [Streptosporangium becharense]MBB5822694.1 hypothetical protein [Streptosporangium becharense]